MEPLPRVLAVMSKVLNDGTSRADLARAARASDGGYRTLSVDAHRARCALLLEGGDELVASAVRRAAASRIGFGERLDVVLGRDAAIDFSSPSCAPAPRRCSEAGRCVLPVTRSRPSSSGIWSGSTARCSRSSCGRPGWRATSSPASPVIRGRPLGRLRLHRILHCDVDLLPRARNGELRRLLRR
jgi:hypothetical protein